MKNERVVGKVQDEVERTKRNEVGKRNRPVRIFQDVGDSNVERKNEDADAGKITIQVEPFRFDYADVVTISIVKRMDTEKNRLSVAF